MDRSTFPNLILRNVADLGGFRSTSGYWYLRGFQRKVSRGFLVNRTGTKTQCSVGPTVPILFTEKPLKTSQKPNFGRIISICFGNRPITDFFHDQEIFTKDYELYEIGQANLNKVWCIKNCTKLSNILLLYLVRILMHQTLLWVASIG